MNQLAALIHNFNTDCYKQYTKVSSLLGNKLDESLKEVERFYYSDFWENRYFQALDIQYLSTSTKLTEIARAQGATSYLREEVKFTISDESSDQNGVSNTKNMIALNINMKDLNDYHINNIIMHEFGHLQYMLPEFYIIKEINKNVIKNPGLFIKSNEILTRKDYSYFTDDNELRQRIIPIIKEMYDNNWTSEEAYELSENLKKDDIKDIFTKDYILELLNNIL